MQKECRLITLKEKKYGKKQSLVIVDNVVCNTNRYVRVNKQRNYLTDIAKIL